MNRIKELRKANNKTQRDIANLTGYGQTLVSKWENFEREPDNSTLKKIANYFNVSVDYLIGNEQELKKVGIQPTYTATQQKILNLISDMSEEDLHDIEIFIRGYKSGKQNKNEFKVFN